MKSSKPTGIAASLFFLLALMSVSTFVQSDLSGQWEALQHSDWIDRGPGPDIEIWNRSTPVKSATRRSEMFKAPRVGL